jgi:hypothetical protein
MSWLFIMALGPVIAGVILASLWWLVRGRKRGLPSGALGVFALAAGLTLVIIGVALRLFAGPLTLLLDLPGPFRDWHADYRFALPLCLGILGVTLVALPIRARNGRGAADLKPRTALSFVRGRWFATPAAVLALILIFTITAGAASEPDDRTGRYTMYWVNLGGERAMGTSIYGWFYSIPALILLAVMIATAFLALVLVSRPALDHDQERDVYTRTVRSCNIVWIGTGALLVHLGLIFSSLAGTASMRSTFATSDGAVRFWTTFAAIQPVLAGAASVAAALGFTLWTAVALSAIPSKRLIPVAARS